MYLQYPTSTFNKNYLINTESYDYESAYDLIYELFSKHIFIDREAELYLYQLLKETGYGSIEKIPIDQLNGIVNYFLKSRDQYRVNYDEERLTYLLLAAIKSEEIILSIDKLIISELRDPISLDKRSTITFFKKNKLNTIKFKSL